eukprot:scaffold8428_cov19-Tisochrysis_lutea.AAC.2
MTPPCIAPCRSAHFRMWMQFVCLYALRWTLVPFNIPMLKERLHHCTLQIVDAVFVCFALDRDMNTCTIVEVHEVVSKLPTVGPVFEQPDGRIAYGNPQRV